MKRLLHVSERSIWRHRDLQIMLPARAVSFFGDELAALVLTLRVYAEGRGPWAITGLLLCFAVPVVVLAPVAGRLVDAVPFRTLAVATGIWQAACCVGLAAAGSLWSIYLLVVLLQTGQVVAAPTWQALLPSIAEREEVGRAVGTSQALSTVASVAAPAAAGLAVARLGYGAPLLLDAATFLLLAGAGLSLRTRRRLARDEGAEPDSKGSSDAFSLRSDPLLWPLLVGLCALVLVGEVTNVVEVFMVRGTLGASTLAFGLVAAVLAGGIVVGSMVAGRNASDGVRAQRTVVAALALAIALALGGLAPGIWLFAALWAIVGVSNGFANVDASTLVLNRTPEFSRGRVLARVNGMVRGSSLGALVLGGVAGTALGPRGTFVASGTLMALFAALLLIRIRGVLSNSQAAHARSSAPLL